SLMRTIAPIRTPTRTCSTVDSRTDMISTMCDGRSTSHRIRSTRFVPPAMYFAAARDPDCTADGTSCSRTKSNGCIAGLRNCLDDAEVAAAAADVAAHPLADVLVGLDVTFTNQRD